MGEREFTIKLSGEQGDLLADYAGFRDETVEEAIVGILEDFLRSLGNEPPPEPPPPTWRDNLGL